jgi:predicted Zn-dependent peptidase
MLPTGSAEVVKSAAPQGVADYHALYVKAGASVLAISGRFDPEKTAPIIEGLFGSLPAGDNALPDLAAPAVGQEGRTRVHPSPLNTAGIIVSAPGMRVADVRDCLAVDVLDTIISGYNLPRGWLHDELRGKELVYVVHAYNWPLQVPGAFVVYANCEPDKADQVAGIIRDNLRKTLSHRFTAAEVEEAVNFILTAELLEKQSPSALSMQAALDELYGRGYDFRGRYEGLLRAVTPEEVARVARKYLSAGYVTTVVRPLAASTAPAGR